MNNAVLDVKQISVALNNLDEEYSVLQDVSLKIENEIHGIVGESGCGKSMLMKAIMSILPQNARIIDGEIWLNGSRIDIMDKEEQRKLRGNEVAMIFQDPMTSLDPMKTVGFHMYEIFKRQGRVSRKEWKRKAEEALKEVGISEPEKRLKQYPHEFSGGMRQRVMIAMAICCHPKLLIADEPTTALDVTIQAQILELILKLQKEENMSVILITHDLSVIASVCSKVVVMYAGRIVEKGSVEDIFYRPRHPYTQALLEAMPQNAKSDRLRAISGRPPFLDEVKTGCPFAPRCRYSQEICSHEVPKMERISTSHEVMCHCITQECGEIKNG